MAAAGFPWGAAGAGAAAVVAAAFAATLAARGLRRASDRAWCAGLAAYGLAAALEAGGLLAGWSPGPYRAYLAAAALNVGLLGFGTVALLGPRAARAGAAVLAALAALLLVGLAVSPVDVAGGAVEGADGIPRVSPARLAFAATNILGGLALVVGALVAGWRARRPGVLLIGAGALLPFLGGTLDTLDVAAVRVALQLAGVAVMFAGYLVARAPGAASATPAPEGA